MKKMKIKCELCGRPLTDEPDANIYVLLGGKGDVFCEQCEAQAGGVTMPARDLRVMFRSISATIIGVDVPYDPSYEEAPEPDFDALILGPLVN